MRPSLARLPSLSLLALVSALAGVAEAQAEPPQVRCGLLERLPDLRHVELATSIALADSSGPKLSRDPFGVSYTVRESPNFSVKWTGAQVTEIQAQVVLTALEEAWALHIESLGHRAPAGAESFRVNAYISRPEDTPSIDFGGGYATIDHEGYPFLVLSHELFAYGVGNENLRHTAVHEFYHLIQLTIGAYYSESAYWYWEATAEWASQELFPHDVSGYAFIGAYALATELPLFYYGDPFGDPVSGVHQYGASIFPRYVTQRFEDPTLIVATWEAPDFGDDPLRALADGLPAGTLGDAFADFAARNAVWDYPQREVLAAVEKAYLDFFPERSREVAELYPDRAGVSAEIAPSRLPRSLGYNVIRIERPNAARLVVGVDADAAGSSGTPSALAATLVTTRGPGFTYTPIPLGAAGDGEIDVSVEPGDRFHLVVAATSDRRSSQETFAYRVHARAEGAGVGPDPDPDPDEEIAAGCGCRAGGDGTQAPLFLAVLLLGIFVLRRHPRRYRESDSASSSP